MLEEIIEYTSFEEMRMQELYNIMWEAAAEINNISVINAKSIFTIRSGIAEDFDKFYEHEYEYDWTRNGDHIAFEMSPIYKFEVVGIFGWINGNLGDHVEHIEIWIGNEKLREYPGYLLWSVSNTPHIIDKIIDKEDILNILENYKITNKRFLFTDPVFGTKDKVLRIIVNTFNASRKSKAFPLFWVIKKR